MKGNANSQCLNASFIISESTVTLDCSFRLEAESLYSIKLYKVGTLTDSLTEGVHLIPFSKSLDLRGVLRPEVGRVKGGQIK